MIIASQIYLDTVGVSGEKIAQIKRELTYSNPKFQQAELYGFYSKNIPQTIEAYSFRDNGRYLVIPRGYFSTVKRILPDEPVDNRTITHPSLGLIYENKEFELDERQKRCVEAMVKKKQGIIHAATSAGKSAILLAAIAKIDQPTLVIVRQKSLITQLYGDAKKWIHIRGKNLQALDDVRNRDHQPKDVPHVRVGGNLRRSEIYPELFGRLGDGLKTIGLITFAVDKSLAIALKKDPTLAQKFGCIIQDECHQSPCSTFQKIMAGLPATRRYGLTGTLKRKDRMDFLITATYGSVIATITKDELLEADRISPVNTVIVSSDAEVPEEVLEMSLTKKTQTIDKIIHADKERLTLILDYVRGILERNPNATIAVVSRYVEPCYYLHDIANNAGWFVSATITGRDSGVEKTLSGLRDSSIRVGFCTLGCFSTGINIPQLTDIVLISPLFSNELLIHQLRGRLYRKSAGKTHGTLHLIWDQYIFPPWKRKRFISIMNK